jgi:hypothetical protein
MQMFGVTGAGLSTIRSMQNGGKRARHSIDAWDRVCWPLASELSQSLILLQQSEHIHHREAMAHFLISVRPSDDSLTLGGGRLRASY